MSARRRLSGLARDADLPTRWEETCEKTTSAKSTRLARQQWRVATVRTRR
jgi:hypothetical protein